ncbi:MAG: (Fe-S)-binding protein [bacterium]
MLVDVADQIYKCLRCGWCREKTAFGMHNICPAREILGFESSFGRGRVLLARGVLEGELTYSDKLIERMYTCFGCAACKVKCPLEVDTVEIFRAMREDAVQRGVPQPQPLAQINAVIAENKNPFGKQPAERDKMLRDLNLPVQGEVLYFGGCYDTLRNPAIFKGTVKLLEGAGVKPAYLGQNEWCCGVPQIWSGRRDLAVRLAEHNVDEINKAGATLVVTSCAGCYNAFGHYYRLLLGELPFQVMHITQFLAQALEKNHLPLNSLEQKIQGTITYHDPCHLGRHMGIYEEPRILLRNMFPASFQEMPRNRDDSWCCGGGAVVFPYLTQYSLQVADKRIAEAQSIDARTIVTTCPSCVNVLRLAGRRKGVDVKNIVELMAIAVG